MKKNDIILIAVVLLAAAFVFSWSASKKSEEGGEVIVYVDGKENATYSLDEKGEYLIKTEHGKNLLVIKDGKADVTEADCPDKLCVKQNQISKNGETIVCLPHKVVVEVVSSKEAQFDAISR